MSPAHVRSVNISHQNSSTCMNDGPGGACLPLEGGGSRFSHPPISVMNNLRRRGLICFAVFPRRERA